MGLFGQMIFASAKNRLFKANFGKPIGPCPASLT